MQEEIKFVWVFHGLRGQFASAVFSSKEKAEEWINQTQVQGILTKYPLDVSAYDWALKHDYFIPKKEEHKSAEFIQKFSSADNEHYHYVNDDEL